MKDMPDAIITSDTILEEFKYFLENCTKSPNSFRNYSSGLKTVAEYIRKFNPEFTSLLDYTDVVYLQAVYDKLMTFEEFVERDSGSNGKSMYSNAFQSYLMFLKARKYFSHKTIKDESYVASTEGGFEYRSYIAAIHTKPFILLAGVSGTGKSRIVRELARACDTIDENPWKMQVPSNFCMLPVKPNWHDSTDLLGYVTRISGEAEFVLTEFLQFIIKAWTYPDVPFFLCLDEMNLAPVEQYFAEYLSCIESRKLRDGKIVTDPIFPVTDEPWYEKTIERLAGIKDRETFTKEGISIPQNLIVMGTVNMDETTFTFSRKVLDRAMTIEMNDVDLYGGLDNTTSQFTINASQLIGNMVEGKDIYSQYKEDCDIILNYLETVNNALNHTPFQIAYRTRNEFLLYVIENLKYQGEHSKQYCMARALDEITSMKILSRIEGDDSKLRTLDGQSLLVHLQKVIKEALVNILDGQVLDAEKKETLNICHKKLKEMERKLQNGYCSFWT